jgi:hypothetical protein
MKLSALLIIASAGLLQANASPLRLIVVGPEGSLSPQAGSNNENVAHIQTKVLMKHPEHLSSQNGTHRGCSGARYRQKSIELSNALREIFGLPLIQTEFVPVHGSKPKKTGFYTLPFSPAPNDGKGRIHVHLNGNSEEDGEHRIHKHHHHHHDGEMRQMEDGEEGHHHHMKHMRGHFRHNGSFLRRVHLALMSLGPWEGRAVAFVLGCGLGVLLRMLWVLSVVTYRAIKGQSEDETEYVPVLNQLDAEEIFVAPPVYIVDEKAPLKEEMKAAEDSN